MNAGNWIELAALMVTILGGGGIGVSRMTRVAVAIETIGKGLESLGAAAAGTSAVVAEHETRLAVHDQQISALKQPGAP